MYYLEWSGTMHGEIARWDLFLFVEGLPGRVGVRYNGEDTYGISNSSDRFELHCICFFVTTAIDVELLPPHLYLPGFRISLLLNKNHSFCACILPQVYRRICTRLATTWLPGFSPRYKQTCEFRLGL